jgi:hypothetical protein
LNVPVAHNWTISCFLLNWLISCSVSLESSVMGHDEMLQVLKEKMRLEGQLESLSSEANQVTN